MDAEVKNRDMVAEGLTTVAGGARFLDISRSKMYTEMDAGRLPYVKIGKSRRIPKRALRDFAAENLIGGPDGFTLWATQK